MDERIIAEILKFRDERGWKQYHNPKDLAISLSLEVAELLENFQWSSSEEAVSKRIPNIREELADVLIYSVLFAEAVGLDLNDIIMEKLSMNNQKYPIEKAFGKKEKYTEL
ncbi:MULTISPECIES: nucleotide pyrophosphohydrolase [Desulfitobacterium]|uniref:Putative pyrophosphatase n=1 Tax=Desulfitobacterium dehalogenans (strain ATCC 51507 / DSM 9161 / JW/IU-DC1) TaxID=756499 RepID=I4A7V4_DESDJ|nr:MULTISPECIES: nucleotide pyrophosphohydrolase [Desulfitobacterium]AFM00039.1 putative pyrophosphatase [Desulfitobacterium dehalogenans ATCC 51507]